MNNRIKELRKTIGLTQEEFAKRINISRVNICSIELGKVSVTERVFSDVVREFNTNPEWLETGEGEMFLDTDGKYTDFAKMIMERLEGMPNEYWEQFEKIYNYVMKNEKK